MRKFTIPGSIALAALLTVTFLGCDHSTDKTPAASQSEAAEFRPSAAATTREFSIEGMTCGGCANSASEAIKAVPGVEKVQVSLKEKKAVVVADPAVATSEKIEAALTAADFKAKQIETREAPPSGTSEKQQSPPDRP